MATCASGRLSLDRSMRRTKGANQEAFSFRLLEEQARTRMSDDYTPVALMADDDPIIRMKTSDTLEDAGFRVYEAAGAEGAIEIGAVA